jgi:hypothetical protein
MLHLACRPTVLAGDPGRVLAFFEKPRLIEHQHAICLPQMLAEVAPQFVADGVGLPVGPAQQVLKAIGGRLAADFGQLPAVLALGCAEQSLQVGEGTPPRFRPGNIGPQPVLHISQVGPPTLDRAGQLVRGSRGQCVRYVCGVMRS